MCKCANGEFGNLEIWKCGNWEENVQIGKCADVQIM